MFCAYVHWNLSKQILAIMPFPLACFCMISNILNGIVSTLNNIIELLSSVFSSPYPTQNCVVVVVFHDCFVWISIQIVRFVDVSLLYFTLPYNYIHIYLSQSHDMYCVFVPVWENINLCVCVLSTLSFSKINCYSFYSTIWTFILPPWNSVQKDCREKRVFCLFVCFIFLSVVKIMSQNDQWIIFNIIDVYIRYFLFVITFICSLEGEACVWSSETLVGVFLTYYYVGCRDQTEMVQFGDRPRYCWAISAGPQCVLMCCDHCSSFHSKTLTPLVNASLSRPQVFGMSVVVLDSFLALSHGIYFSNLEISSISPRNLASFQ